MRTDFELITKHLWSSKRPSSEVWAIVDGARREGLARAVRFSALDHCCLYSGNPGQVLLDVAPYLVHLRKGWRFTRELIEKGWGDSRAIFLTSDATLDQLRYHFRRFLQVQDETGNNLIFRYYDPRVLRIYLPTCNAIELRLFFGPVETYMIEGEESDVLLIYSLNNDKLNWKSVRLHKE